MKNISKKEIIDMLRRDGVGVLPTDTLYGVVGSALSRKAVARIYKVRKRDLKKPLIILIHSFRDLDAFGVLVTEGDKKMMKKVWPGGVSVLLPCPHARMRYLHRGTKMLAFRVPADTALRSLLKKTGPLVAPSANTEGARPAQTITQARKYFGEKIDFYMDGGRRVRKPSTLVALENGVFTVMRKGAVKVKIPH